MNNDVAIKMVDVSKYYKLYTSRRDRIKELLTPGSKLYHEKFYALNGINLEVKKNETIGIMGMNGSGKSTLLKIISGILRPNNGTVTVNGKISALIELGSAFNPEFTGIENIYFYGMLLGIKKDEMKSKIDDILSFADIGVFINQPIKTYSSGMKSRLGFSVAVNVNPDILILDEVLAVGDELFKRKCYAKMEELFSDNKTILLVSHSASSIKTMCNRAIILDNGNLIMDDNAKYVTTHYRNYILAKRHDKKYSLDEDDDTDTRKNYEQKLVKINSDNEHSGDSYDPELISESTLVLKNYDVAFNNHKLETLDGNLVNILITGHKYKFRYKVSFNFNISDVSMGVNIKSIKGINISGVSQKKMNNMLKEVKKGDFYEIEWYFECLLLEGIYFIDTYASGIINGERKNIYRINDFFVFKVIGNEKNRFAGLVTLNQKINVHKCASMLEDTN